MIRVHRTAVGTYHPVPGDEMAWAVHDTRGYLDNGPACDMCGECECAIDTSGCGNPLCQCDCLDSEAQDCAGLSFAYVLLDGGETLCEECANDEGLEVIRCNCGEEVSHEMRTVQTRV